MKLYVDRLPGCYHARVKDAGRLIATCRHAHRTYDTAMKCAEKLARRRGWKPTRLFLVRTTKYGTIQHENTSQKEAAAWAENTFGRGQVLTVEYPPEDSR